MERTLYLIKTLNLTPHPEGGYFKEIYRSEEIIPDRTISGFEGERNVSTSIYFLLAGNDKSMFHKIKSDELWHFYEGAGITIHTIDKNGKYKALRLGDNLKENEQYQIIVPGNTWFAAEVNEKHSYALVGCTVAPGFDFKDFQLGKRKELISLFPQHSKLINKFTTD